MVAVKYDVHVRTFPLDDLQGRHTQRIAATGHVRPSEIGDPRPVRRPFRRWKIDRPVQGETEKHPFRHAELRLQHFQRPRSRGHRKEAELIGLAGPYIVGAHGEEHRLEVLQEIDVQLGLVSIGFHHIGGRPIGADENVALFNIIDAMPDLVGLDVEEFLGDEIANFLPDRKPVVVGQDVQRAVMAKLRQIANGAEDVSVPTRSFEGLRNNPGDPQSLRLGRTRLARGQDHIFSAIMVDIDDRLIGFL